MSRIARVLVLAGVAAAFLTAASTPCPDVRTVHDTASGSDVAILAPCPCHHGDQTAASAASQLDPVLCATTAQVVLDGRAIAPLQSPAVLPRAPRSLPDPVPISS
jgi:hypothetical protein